MFCESLSLPGGPCSCVGVSNRSALPEIWLLSGHCWLAVNCCAVRDLEIVVCTVYLGTSKKKAKHNAAISLLNQMGVLPALVNGQTSNTNGFEICIL